MNLLCVAIWVIFLAEAIVKPSYGKPVSPVSSISAMVICIVHFLEKWLGG